ncbi:hypothetical protein [Kitasatospora sp. NPDC059803]|uniref:hypothetical protein n=1 Tax=Kitasatospora sp. NPDC059803 TaxID=3346953 RepID=UPI003649B590
MRAVPRPRTGEGAVVLGVIALLLLEVVALVVLPARDRPVVGGALFGAGVAGLAVAGVLWQRLRRRRHPVVPQAEADQDSWFSAHSLEGFPMEAVRPLLLGAHAPSLNTLYTAWVFATHGHDAGWIARHLSLPAGVVRLLADARPAGRTEARTPPTGRPARRGPE